MLKKEGETSLAAMESSQPAAEHPRPSVDEEEPPAKQLRLSTGDVQVPSVAQKSQAGISDVSAMVVKSAGVEATETLIFGIAGVIVEAGIDNVDCEQTAAAVGSADLEFPASVHDGYERIATGVQTVGSTLEPHAEESDVSAMVIETVSVGATEAPISGIADVIAEAGIENADGERMAAAVGFAESDTPASDSNGKDENGLHLVDERIAPAVQCVGSGLPSDLGAGTSAVQRTKTSLCSYFRKKGCKHGAACRYAHGEEELRQRPDGSWDPTSERAKVLLQKTAVPPDAKVVVAVPEPAKAPGMEEMDKSGASALSKCIVHVPRAWSVDHFKKFLTESDVSYTTAKKRKGMSVAFVGFKTPEDVVKATKILDGKFVNKNNLKVADSRSRSWEKDGGGVPNKIENDGGGLDDNVSDDGGVGDLELAAISADGATVRNVCDAVTPLAHMPYDEQLNMKRDSITQVLKRLVRNTRKGISSGALLPDWISSARDKGGLPCVLKGVLASPIVDGYRNKCEFSIGCSADGQRVVGFQVGSFREGILAVEEPTDCRNVSTVALTYAAAFQEFVRQSELAVWNKKNNSGFWRLLIVREGRAARIGDESSGNISPISEVMLIVQVCSTGIAEERRNMEYAKMVDALSRAAESASPPLPLTALLVQDHEGISNVASTDAPLHPLVVRKSENVAEVANEYIHDHIGKLLFRVSPTAFFQVNTLAAERLYSLAGDWAGLTPDTLLFDVCCGTGTIGLTLAHRVGLVVGIEMNASAVADAQKNAEINHITNCRFVCGKAEDVMESLLKEYLASGEKDAIQTACEAEMMKPEDDSLGHINDPTATKQSSTISVKDENLEHETEGEDSALGSTSEMDSAMLGMSAASDQLEQVSGLKSDGDSRTTRIGLNDAHKEGRQPKQRFKNIVAIVDPPRVGLHPVVLKTLRLHPQLHRLVYISCNPLSLLANAVELCTPLSCLADAEKGKGAWRGRANWRGMSNVGQARQRVKKMPPSEPFKPMKAIAVDLFPHTVHCEMVMLLERSRWHLF